MEAVMDWWMHYRTEADMRQLASMLRLGRTALERRLPHQASGLPGCRSIDLSALSPARLSAGVFHSVTFLWASSTADVARTQRKSSASSAVRSGSMEPRASTDPQAASRAVSSSPCRSIQWRGHESARHSPQSRIAAVESPHGLGHLHRRGERCRVQPLTIKAAAVPRSGGMNFLNSGT